MVYVYFHNKDVVRFSPVNVYVYHISFRVVRILTFVSITNCNRVI